MIDARRWSGRMAWSLAIGFLLGGALAPLVVQGDGPPDTALSYETGPFEPTWDSLAKGYECPQWFRDAKFGIWAHWGVQCVPETGDWCARLLYAPEVADSPWQTTAGKAMYAAHVAKYGHPSQFGLKDLCHEFKADRWDPQRLVKLYKRAGARYFVAMANHHDNFDNWDSTYQSWNSVKIGPKKDLIGLWAQAAREENLPFGVSVHAARAWQWLTPAFGSDRAGPLQGVPYDGHAVKTDGVGKWWEGFDPQELYGAPHAESDPPPQAYIDKFYLRIKELIDRYQPALLYFDDRQSPLGAVGLKIAAHYYNSSLKRRAGVLDVVLNTKGNDELTCRAVVDDLERGAKEAISPAPWQTDTCIGNWHYKKGQVYKTPEQVVQMLVDVVSKNGNLLLNIPVRGDGTIDQHEEAIVEQIAQWMSVHGEAIYGTRPWTVFGEGPHAPKGGAMQESPANAYTQQDFRYTTKDGVLYAFCMVVPEAELQLKSLGTTHALGKRKIASLELLGSNEQIPFSQNDDALVVACPKRFRLGFGCICFKIRFQ